MPFIAAAPGRYDDRTSRSSTCIRILVSRPHGELLDHFRRKVLQEPADEIVGIISPVDREFIVQSRTSACRYGSNASFRRIGWLHRFCSWRKIGNVGEASLRQRQTLQILPADDPLVHHARQIDWLGRNGGVGAFDRDGLRRSYRLQTHGHFPDRTHSDRYLGLSFPEARRRYCDLVVAGEQVIHPELAPI